MAEILLESICIVSKHNYVYTYIYCNTFVIFSILNDWNKIMFYKISYFFYKDIHPFPSNNAKTASEFTQVWIEGQTQEKQQQIVWLNIIGLKIRP